MVFMALNFLGRLGFYKEGFGEQAPDNLAKAITPYGAEDCIGKDKDSVRDAFLLAGFFNIVEEKIEDLAIDETDRYGTVEAVSINSVADFEGNKTFHSSARVVIKYHSYVRVGVPISSEEVKYMDTDLVLEAFEAVGFVNITIDEKYDLDPETTKAEYENEISVDGMRDFGKREKFPLNSNIEIIVHKPYEKCKLKVVVDFIPNLIFSTYDVKFEIDGKSETLKHGKDAQFEYSLKQGEYTLTFQSAESSSVKGTVKINLKDDTEVAYKINCYSDKVSVETKYIEIKSDVGENEAMVPTSASDCKYENYKDIEKAFKNAGFTNVKTEILYDIVLGWTDEGEVEKVSINGATNFKRGNIFEKDAAVIITYHMKEKDDPNKKQETKPNTSEQDNTTPTFYSTNDSKTAKKGNSGVFSYKNKKGSYDVYWIINFDEGYVYTFTNGNGASSCDKLKIVSGHLNDRIIITWHDGGNQVNWYLHFKYVDNPVTLVVNDHLGFTTEFAATNLNDALQIRGTKTIKAY